MGEFEARTTPVARTSATGGFGLKLVPGSYCLTIQAPGFGAQTFKNVAVAAGATKSLAFTVAPNLASWPRCIGRLHVEPGRRAARVVPARRHRGDRAITVRLAKPATISTIQVSAFKNTTSARFAALEDFTFQVSDDGVLWKTVKTGGFGYQAPRPTAPDLHYKSFALTTPTHAAYVRFFIDSVQGETLTYAQAAELQVFGNAAGVSPTAPPARRTG